VLDPIFALKQMDFFIELNKFRRACLEPVKVMSRISWKVLRFDVEGQNIESQSVEQITEDLKFI
jgi:hypothetical protein